jgi:uncharacterized damage-inducible protein DinB
MHKELERLTNRLASEAEKTITFFADLPLDSWKQQVYTTGSCWNVRQILAHFVATERALTQLMNNVIEGGSGVPAYFEIDAFNEREVEALDKVEIPILLDDFQRARSEIIGWVRGLGPEDLDRTGLHPWFGETELRKMLKLVYRHNMIHLRDVRKALAEHAPVPHENIQPPAEENRLVRKG